MEDSKWIIKSRAFWAMLAPLVAWAFALFGQVVKAHVEWVGH